MLTVLEVTRPTPAENLAFDDELLESGAELLRLWESPHPFIVLGRSCRPETDVNIEACRAENVEIHRRSSGGGTVLLGPGCLNYSLILNLDTRPALHNITHSYHLILSAVISSLKVPGLTIAHTDILLDGRKVSGCAQRRTRTHLLHHGTLLGPSADLSLIIRLLKEPPRQPAHRARRPHSQFLSVLPACPRQSLARLAAAIGP